MDRDVAAIQDTLRNDVLPQIESELALEQPDAVWLAEWLSDTASIARILRRHKFVRSFTLQGIHAIAIWRLRVLRPILLLPTETLFHCLPPPITDALGRPMVFFKLTSLRSLSCDIKHALLQEAERLRLHLRYIHDHHMHTGSFPPQYLLLVDLDGVSMQNYNLDLCLWITSEIIPRYPGMVATVFLLNYSWIHFGTWSLAKRILPSSVIARVFFSSGAELVRHCSAANLPAEYGGLLPALDHIDNALQSPYQTRHLPPPLPVLQDSSPSPPGSDLQRVPSTVALPPLSSRNPFFGYPAVASASSPHTIRHVQKGTRELLRTLAVLWWRRWGPWVRAGTWAGVCTLILALLLQMRHVRTRTSTIVSPRALVRELGALSTSMRARRASR